MFVKSTSSRKKMEILLILLTVVQVYAVVNGPQRREISIINKDNNLIISSSRDIITPSIELALSKCQEIFQYDRWNCPSSDFVLKRKSQQRFDRESAFVEALTAAALLYTITKKCAAGQLSGCHCEEREQLCSDDPVSAENILKEILYDDKIERQSSDTQGYAKMHNNHAGRLVVKNSLITRCRCNDVSGSDDNDGDNFETICKRRKCWTTLKDFTEIAMHIRRMYDNALILKVHNSGTTDWSNIPRNHLIFVNESPNYCLAGAIPQWLGMEGRQCSRGRGKDHTIQQRRSCKHLCRECGLRVRSKIVTSYRKCNCTFVWCCEVKCEKCEDVKTLYFCG